MYIERGHVMSGFFSQSKCCIQKTLPLSYLHFPHIFGVKVATFCSCLGFGNDVSLLLHNNKTGYVTSTWGNGPFVTHKEVTLLEH